MSTSDHRLMFGTSISNNSQIILLQIMAYLESFANCEGIFRKSGSKQRIDQLVRDLREKDFQQILLSEKYKPHDYASMLKQYFSELVEPLLLKRHLYAYLQTAGTTRSIALLYRLVMVLILFFTTAACITACSCVIMCSLYVCVHRSHRSSSYH